ncbi:pre-mRNA-splicing factor 38B-like isoform X2 [Ctenocephalides felis]|nr:pre-mRNA-splicing factor 38B-like isoform X2 [Ctenocephalides felis]XP_026468634.1 pre-mRNA-splicing factor 38B-like isoform X2 [Ctenocephalides felis]
MNLNPLILANIQSSSYFKVHLFKLKTYHEVVDEIYYQVKHLEPWEKGSRKTAGQTGMCGGVRGVGAGGIVSTAFCLLYKLYTLRLTRKQVNGLLTHTDSPYIRALGFMYIRYTQPPPDLFDWYEEYLCDEEEIDVKAGGGQITTIGSILRQWLVKLDWFSTLFPRIPVPVQKQIEQRLAEYDRQNKKPEVYNSHYNNRNDNYNPRDNASRSRDDSGNARNFGEAERYAKDRNERYNREHERSRDRHGERSSGRDRDRYLDRERSSRDYRERSREKDRSKHRSDHSRNRSRSRERHRRHR